MKKNLLAVLVMVTGALTISPLSMAIDNSSNNNSDLPSVMYASVEKNHTYDSVQNTVDKKYSNITDDKYDSHENIEREDMQKLSISNVKKSKNNKKYVYSNKRVDTVKGNFKKRELKYEKSVKDTNNEKVTQELSREEALNILKNKTNCDYKYMGDENTFNVLKEKGQLGYVFLPDVQTDLGLFVNKNTGEVYTFHPSGSLDLY